VPAAHGHAAPKLLQTARGRLCWQEYGIPDGLPVFYCHGFPASRLEARKSHEAARELGLRVLSLDRPGFGRSDFVPGRRLSDWADTVHAVADAEGIDRFSLMGVSGGGPYALSAAAGLGDRVTRLALVCPLGPLAEPGSDAGMRTLAAAFVRFSRAWPTLAPWLYRACAGPVFRTFPAAVVRVLAGTADDMDRATLCKPEHRAMILDSVREAFRQGARGAAHDLHLFTRSWDFDPATITAPARLWHGGRDRTVPCRHGAGIAQCLRHCDAHYPEDEGHFSLALEHMRSIMEFLANPD